MKTMHLTINFLSALCLLFLIHVPTALAQTQTAATPKTETPSPSDDGWHVGITPYIWFAGVHGTVGALDHQASVHASFGDIFNYLNIGAMASVEPRYNRIVMPFDFLWMQLSDNKALPFDEGATSVKAKMTETLITQKIGYRFVERKDSRSMRFSGSATGIWKIRSPCSRRKSPMVSLNRQIGSTVWVEEELNWGSRRSFLRW